MAQLIECPECGDGNTPDATYCTCGYNLSNTSASAASGDFADTVIDAAAIIPSSFLPRYNALRCAVPIIRGLAVLTALIGLYTILKLIPETDGPGVFFIAVGAVATQTFFMWISGDVIRILLDIRTAQDIASSG